MKKFYLVTLNLAVSALLTALVVCIGISGCAKFGTFSTGAQTVVDFACSPTDLQKAEAVKWLAALDSIQAGASAFFPAAAIVKASSAMTVLKDGGCFVLAEIQDALTLLSDMQAKQVKMMGVKAAPRTIAEQFPALTAAVNKGK